VTGAGASSPAIWCNGDVLTTLDLRQLVQAHRASGAIATIASHARQVKIDLGVPQFDGEDVLTGYIEKPVYNSFVSWVFASNSNLVDSSQSRYNQYSSGRIAQLVRALR
jgi:NDP-sugar pyrophosphorylase family protein